MPAVCTLGPMLEDSDSYAHVAQDEDILGHITMVYSFGFR